MHADEKWPLLIYSRRLHLFFPPGFLKGKASGTCIFTCSAVDLSCVYSLVGYFVCFKIGFFFPGCCLDVVFQTSGCLNELISSHRWTVALQSWQTGT